MRTEHGFAPDPFHLFERDGWERVPEEYDHAFGALTAAAVGPLLDAAAVHQDVRVLDVATGPGYAAAAATRRGATPVGIDFSHAMVERARMRHPEIEFLTGDAEELPFEDASFDAVVTNFGLLHLSRPERALAESHRVLRPGGRLAFTVWCGPDEAVGFGIVLRAVDAHGTPDVQLPPGPPFFRFSDLDQCVQSLTAAGFESPRARKCRLEWRLPSPDSLFEYMYGATVRTAGLLRAQPTGVLDEIRAAILAEAARYRRGDAVRIPMPAVVASAVKPR